MSESYLRDYQSNARSCIFKEWEAVVSTLLILPTGGGKTVVIASVLAQAAQQWGKRALVLAHRKELIWQARDKIERFGKLECSIEMGELTAMETLFGKTPVVVSTIQTLNSELGDRKRMSRFDPTEFSVVVIDEGHHATADSYKSIINYFRTKNPEIKVLGVTATPDRADEEALGQIFDTVAFDYEILDAIHDGWLVPVDQQFVDIAGLDYSAVRTTAGDLNGADLAAVMEQESNMQGVAGAAIDIVGGRRAISFTTSVKQAEILSNILNRHRSGMSDWVHGGTPDDVRADMLRRFRDGKIQHIANCGVLTEGFDDPGVEVVIMARPTKSRALYAQQVGRAMRPLPNIVDGLAGSPERRQAIADSLKKSCCVVDFVGNSGKHKLVTSADILGGKVSDDAIARAIIKAKKKGGPVRISEELDKAEEEIRAEAEKRRLEAEAGRAKLLANVKYQSKSVNPFDLFQITPEKERGWDKGKVLSEKQKQLLLKNGINPDKLTYTQGKQVLNEMFRRWDKKLATLGQMKLLARYGYTDREITKDQASRLIDTIASNGWKRVATTT